MTSEQPPDRRWPRSVYGHGGEPDPRFTFANERTFLAWLRTGLAMLTAGIAVVALAGLDPELAGEAHVASLILVVAGVVCAVSAFWRWARNERALREHRPLPSSMVLPAMVGVIAVVGLIALFLLLP